MTLGSSCASRISLSSRKRPLPLLALLARADPSAVADDVGIQPRLPHLAQQRKCPLPLLALLARADPTVFRHLALFPSGTRFLRPYSIDDVGFQLRLPHLAQQRKRPLPLLALLARADPSVVTR
ncbi:unnamed protein product [Prorocentrum cordatum]|uniref:Uncharacterized protein n=1 Tax=Prorocentrum cordatum TaxID=2364126 RepID=A0ABN9UMD8_9DINO|nr:unnamed protein product [Polarella glacialis]